MHAGRSGIPYLAAAASGGLLAVAHTQSELGWLILLAWTPWCLAAEPARLARTWAQLALLVGLAVALSIHWIDRTGPGFGYLVVAAALYAGALTLLPALLCRVGAHAGRSTVAGLLLLPAGIAALELLGRLIGLKVWWPITAQPLADWPVVTVAASLASPEFLAVPVCATGVALALSVRTSPAPVRIAAWLQGPVLLLALAMGAPMLAADEGAELPLRVGLVQPNVRQIEKWAPQQRAEQLAQLGRLIDALLPMRPALIALPETALVGYVRYENDLTDWVRGTVIRTRHPLLFGSLDRTADTLQPHNVAILITPYDTVYTYAKMHLVPVTESLPSLGPLDPLLRPLLIRLRGGPETFEPGARPELFRLQSGVSFGALICFEDVFPDLLRANALLGVDLVFVLINTERFDGSSAPLQHLRRAQLAAAAVGLPMVRVTNSGISAYIDARGRVVDFVHDRRGDRVGIEGSAVFDVALRQRATPYRRGGDALAFAALGTLVVVLAVVGYRTGR